MAAPSNTVRTVLAVLGVVGLVAAAFATYLVTVVYRPIDIYAVTYEVAGDGTIELVEYLAETEGSRTAPPRVASLNNTASPWQTSAAIPSGMAARVTARGPGTLSCVLYLDKGRSNERVLARVSASAPGQSVTCEARTPDDETLHG
ncbi:hypothetical protein JOF53_006692 [Crossiella equi]|uniref:Uncharacterized protein n=1 Tax=Crossiella equi TaxID=130796 RepID=A0ABS5AQ62_9PSEU|nr:hypothetical protein [Crossiella equi]MBP2477820.1 hypothetical protein [Crossiella equi]